MAGAELLRNRARVAAQAAPAIADITDLDHEGRGVAHVEGKAVFIEDALPGERVEWRRVKSTRTFDEGRLLNVLHASPHRVAPSCAHFGMCGGCVLQHLSAEQQIAFKQQQLLDALCRIGHVHPEAIVPPLQGPQWHYRRRARLAARWVPNKQRTVVGFRERSSSFIAYLKACRVLAEPMANLIDALSDLISKLSVRARVPQVEVAVAENATALVIRVLDEITDVDRAHLESFQRTHNIDIYLQPGGYETVAPLMGTATPLEYTLPTSDVTIQFAPTDFVQINGELNKLMVDRALEWLAPSAEDRVLDLFCGLGNFSLPIARSAAHVTAVEGEPGLVARARENAARNHIVNVDFHVADLFDTAAFRDSAWAKRHYDKVLLDPPRAGAREVLPLIADAGARTVVYVSCHPGTLARDAGILVNEHGFSFAAAGVMDMFPHTAHVESIAIFTRN